MRIASAIRGPPGARALAYRASEERKRQENTGIRESFANEEWIYRELATKCERWPGSRRW
jgi:hypothetical protein